MTKTIITLDDKYLQEGGRVFLSSIQAMLRLLIDQKRRDRHQGLKTSGFVSGYRGSPITTFDAALWSSAKLLAEHDIRFESGLNEELAATSMRGTQQFKWFGPSAYDGCFGMWYAKGVGVDRALEALKQANFEGTSATGGVLVVAGDDHAGKSSITAHQSEHTLIAGLIPVLYPATTAEIIEFGLWGWELSRFSGLYAGLKTITDTLDLSSSIALPDPLFPVVRPNLDLPPGGLELVHGRTPLASEALVVDHRIPAAQAFAYANKLDRAIHDGARRELTIVTAGKSFLDTMQALSELGLDEAACARLGIRLFKPAMIWPLEPGTITDFCRGSREVLVVEEKRPVMEEQLASLFYRLPASERPEISGKRDPNGKPLLSAHGVLSAREIRTAIHDRLGAHGLLEPAAAAAHEEWVAGESALLGSGSGVSRPAFFCSGCPHNTSTNLPDGSNAMGATGCHGLVSYVMPERRTMQPMGMGAEGMPWIAAAGLVETPHMFQNMGDGTYLHSGILAIRAAISAGINITYKILYNDAVAMTGGQPLDNNLSPLDVVRQVAAEGVEAIELVTDDPAKYGNARLPEGVGVTHRDYLDTLQRRFREKKGVSVIVYEQTCATEKRRRRKRGSYPDPDERLFINTAVCEGCGDCSVQSNCVSITPVETSLGRKRRIDQSSCNKDFSCIKGFCPSFVTVKGGRIARRTTLVDAVERLRADLPPPLVREIGEQPVSLLVAGIGGTGVLTIGSVLGMAAHIEGKACSVLDMTGMAQKGGAVTSHIRIGDRDGAAFGNRLEPNMADLILACDLLVGSGNEVLKTVCPGKTVFIGNTTIVPTGSFASDNSLEFEAHLYVPAVERALAGGELLAFDAAGLSQAVTGDTIGTNLVVVGYAAQKGLLPVSIDSVEQAIRLNAVAVEDSLRALACGRVFANDPDALPIRQAGTPVPQSLDSLIASREQHLIDYQDQAYARLFCDQVATWRSQLGHLNDEQRDALLRAAASNLSKLMAYKDEYEVARLYCSEEFHRELREQFEGDFKLGFNLAPPLLALVDKRLGRPRKIEFGPWVTKLFAILAPLRRLRGTALDLFGYTQERRMERQLIRDYRGLVDRLVVAVNDVNFDDVLKLARAADAIRGYGPVKLAAIEAYEQNCRVLSDRIFSHDAAPSHETADLDAARRRAPARLRTH